MQLVALVGAKGSGKTAASDALVECGFVRLRYADGLKKMLRALGLTEAQIDGDEKEIPCDLLGGKSPRWAMQSLGTSWGRKLISDTLWVDIMRNEIVALMVQNPKAKIIVDDCRFPNEEKLVRQLGGELWRVRRPAVEVVLTSFQKWMVRMGLSKKVHISELYWPDFRVDREIENTKSLEALRQAVLAEARRVPVYEVA